MSNVAGYFRGKPACSCLLKWLPAYEAELLRRGLLKSNLDVWQLIGGAAASGGTHALGGCFDIAQTSREQIAIARQMGADATWFRRYNWDGKGGMAHTHGVLRGCPHNGPARYQIDAVDQGYNGLGWMGRAGKDDGPRPLTRRTWQQGIAWANAQAAKKPKPTTLRFGTWNVGLKKPLAAKTLADRLRRIRFRVKQFRLDVLAVQECPSSGQGKHLFGTLIGRDRKPMKRVGSHGRYIFYTSRASNVAWKSWEIEGKRVTAAALTISGRRRVFVNVHPISGSTSAAKKQRERYANKVWAVVLPWAKGEGAKAEDVIKLGDHNGSEAAAVGARRGYVRARAVAAWKTVLTRTYNALGKRKPTHPGGQFDYVLIHKTKRGTVQRYRNVQTPNASDHNLVVVQIKE